MKCKHEPCNNDAKGQGSYCSPTCKTLFNRNKGKAKTVVTPTVTQARNTGDIVASYEHYMANPDQYATRTNPLNLNWGKPMTLSQLNQAGLKGNRVAIPGDHDYISTWQPQGVAPQATGEA